MADQRNPIEADLEQQAAADRVTERVPNTVGGISALAAANAPQVFFDDTAYAAYFRGVGSITLTAIRHISDVDGNGAGGDRVVTGFLRGSLESLQALRKAIDVVEGMAARQLAAAVSAATGGEPPSGSVN